MKINIIRIATILCLATSCTQNRATIQYEKAMLYLDSLKNTDHYAKIDEAIDLLQKSAKAGNAKAQYELGNLYWNNQDSLIPIKIDTLMAIQWYEKSADQCYAQAQYSLAYIYENTSGNLKNNQRAFDLYKAAANQGLADALYSMGRIYQYGITDIVAKNDTIALKYYQQAADLACPAAMLNLGLLYYWGGDMLKADKHKTITLFQKAAELGYAEAQYRLGLSYMYGIEGIVSKDSTKAIKWLKLAAKNDHIKACNELGEYYLYRSGLNINDCISMASEWYGKSVEIYHNTPGLIGLGDTYFKLFIKCNEDNKIEIANIAAEVAIANYIEADNIESRLTNDIEVDNTQSQSVNYIKDDNMEFKKNIILQFKSSGMDGFEFSVKKKMFIHDFANTYYKIGLLYLYIGMSQNDQKSWNVGTEWIHKAAAAGSYKAERLIRNRYHLY